MNTVNSTIAVVDGTMTFAEVKEKFLGMSLVKMSSEAKCEFPGDDDYWECPETCEECPYHVDYDLSLTVDKVFSTRRSFWLQTSKFMFVVDKNAATFELCSAEVSDALVEQIENTGLELKEEQFIFCRTWSDYTPKYFQGKFKCTFVYPCEREKANCLLIVTRGTRYIGDDLRRAEEAYGGKCCYIQSCHCDECGDETMDFWRFQYNPSTDELMVPCEELDNNIDKMIELMQGDDKSTGTKYNLPKAE